MKKKNCQSFKNLLDFNDGIVIDKSHYFGSRIFYEDTDAAGIVYHANYLKFFERGRTSLLNYFNINQNNLMIERGLRFVLREIYIKISDSFRLNDLILIETRHKYAKNSCIYLDQFAWSLNEDFKKTKLKVSSEVQIILIDNKNKVKRIKNILSSSFFEKIT